MNEQLGRGIYPMQYAFFGRNGNLDRAATRRQVDVAVASGAHGVAVLGLATEVNKLSVDERFTLVDWVAEDLAGRLPLVVTVAGATVEAQQSLARHAARAGAAWLVLQPPPERGKPQGYYIDFFAQVMASTDRPVAIQNAPEYTGIGLSDDELVALAGGFPHFRLIKAEGSATAVRSTIEALPGFRVLNGRGGLELMDNLRAGCSGMIPATDSFDYQVRIFEAIAAGHIDEAAQLYQRILPAVVFVMQSLDALICYGKRLAALRMGAVGEVVDRAPAMEPSEFGLECLRRYAEDLGPLRLP